MPLFLHGADVGLKHQIEQPRLGQLAWTSRRARGHARLAWTARLSHLIGAKPLLAEFTIHHRIAEPGDVARSLPHPWVHQNGGVEPLDVIAVPGHAPPPPRLDIVLQLDAERPIVPATVNAPIDFARRENEATTLAERHKLVHHIPALECLGWVRLVFLGMHALLYVVRLCRSLTCRSLMTTSCRSSLHPNVSLQLGIINTLG